MRYAAAAGLWLALTNNLALAHEMTGRELRDYCNDKSGAGALMCAAYVAGYVDGLVTGPLLTDFMTQGKVCIPRTVDYQAAIAMVKQWLKTSEASFIDNPARSVLGVMAWRAFPCEK